ETGRSANRRRTCPGIVRPSGRARIETPTKRRWAFRAPVSSDLRVGRGLKPHGGPWLTWSTGIVRPSGRARIETTFQHVINTRGQVSSDLRVGRGLKRPIKPSKMAKKEVSSDLRVGRGLKQPW